MSTVKCVWKGPNALGEGPLWHPVEHVLYWIDIADPAIHRLDPESGDHQSWPMPKLIGALGFRKSGGFIACFSDEIVAIEITPDVKITSLVDVVQGRDGVRLNDAKCDRAGRFWVGLADPHGETTKGGLYRYDQDGSLHEMETDITISNGLGWSPDNNTFYYTDSLKRTIYAYDFNLDTGELKNRRIFFKVTSDAEPDGLTIDAEGYVWSAEWNGARVVRYSPNGDIDRVIDMPVQRPTSCAFGGKDLSTLYVTSCSQNVNEMDRLSLPAGGLFAIDVGVKGLLEPMY